MFPNLFIELKRSKSTQQQLAERIGYLTQFLAEQTPRADAIHPERDARLQADFCGLFT